MEERNQDGTTTTKGTGTGMRTMNNSTMVPDEELGQDSTTGIRTDLPRTTTLMATKATAVTMVTGTPIKTTEEPEPTTRPRETTEMVHSRRTTPLL